jgi:hypothetical protein
MLYVDRFTQQKEKKNQTKQTNKSSCENRASSTRRNLALTNKSGANAIRHACRRGSRGDDSSSSSRSLEECAASASCCMLLVNKKGHISHGLRTEHENPADWAADALLKATHLRDMLAFMFGDALIDGRQATCRKSWLMWLNLAHRIILIRSSRSLALLTGTLYIIIYGSDDSVHVWYNGYKKK